MPHTLPESFISSVNIVDMDLPAHTMVAIRRLVE